MSITFTHPFWLFALLLPFAALCLYLFIKPAAAITVPAIDFVPARSYSLWHWTQLPKPLLLLAMLCLALALAGLRLSDSLAGSAFRGSSIIICLDASPSMEASDLTAEQWQQLEPGSLPPSRLYIARQLIESFLAEHPGTAIGLVAFARTPYLICPLMPNHTILLQRLQELTTEDFDDGTAIGDALLCALRAIPVEQRQNAAIILLSDGADHGNSQETPEQTAKRCQALGIPIVTLGIGSAMGKHPVKNIHGDWQWEPVAEEIDEEQMQQIATISSGKNLTITDSMELTEVNSFLRQSLTIEKQTTATVIDLTPYLLLAAMIILTLAAILETVIQPRFASGGR